MKNDIILFRLINVQYEIKGVNIRNDNGSQFNVQDVPQFLSVVQANQEFTHLATPEENSYIETYHNIFETEVVKCFEFERYYEAKLTIEAYARFYNNRLLHSGIDFKTPQKKWNELEKKEITKFNSSGEAESGSVGEQPDRNIPMNEDDLGGAIKPVPSDSENLSSLFNMPKKTHTITIK